MTQKIKEGIRLDALDDFLVDDLLTQSDIEILAEFEATEGDAAAYAQAMRERFERVVLASNKTLLAAARAGAVLDRAEAATNVNQPTDIAAARKRLAQALESGRSVSLAARNETRLSDADLARVVRDLDALQARSPHDSRDEKVLGSGSRPDSFLKALGVTEPEEIDLNAIAFCLHARIQYEPLQDCDARIVGYENRSVITVNCESSEQRQRFSAAHEIGHWVLHRGKRLACKVDEASNVGSPLEREADRFAADLLMPIYVFERFAREFDRLTLEVVGELAARFMTSLTSTAIRLVEIDRFPSLLVCHGPEGRKWFRSAPSLPTKLFPKHELASESSAFAVLFGRQPNDPKPRKIKANAWFEFACAERHSVYEQTARIGKDEIITVLTVDKSMLAECR